MIRRASYSDIPAVASLVAEFFDGALEKIGLCLDSETIEDFICSVLDSGIILVIEQDGGISGAIAGVVSPYCFNKGILVLQEYGWFVKPEKRGLESMRMLKEFIEYGRASGATVIQMSSNVREEHQQVVKMYGKMGLHHTDSTFIGRI